MHPQPQSSPPAGQSHVPLTPLGSAPPQPTAALGRSAGSKCLCVLEAALAAAVFFYTALDFVYWASITDEKDDKGLVHETFFFVLVMALMLTDGAFGVALFVTGSAVKTGVAHSLGRSNPPTGTAGGGAGDIDRLERDRLEESLERDGVNVFDFREIVTTSVSVLWGISAFLLLQLVSLVLSLPFSFCLVFFSSTADSETEHVGVWLVFVALELLAFTRLLHRFRFGEKFRSLEQECRTQPSCSRVRVVLVASSIAYALVLYFSPAPPEWQWSLIAVHTVRASKLLVSLRDQSGAMGAATDDPRDNL
eukprot:g7754.t1